MVAGLSIRVAGMLGATAADFSNLTLKARQILAAEKRQSSPFRRHRPLTADEIAQTVNVTVNPTIEMSYEVSGETASAAIANSSMTCGNTTTAACTNWYITRSTGRVSASVKKKGRVFSATATATSTVIVDVTITLPNWSGYQNASNEEKRKWDRFISNLRKHEKGHEDRAISGARSLAVSLPTSASATAKTERAALSTAVSRLKARIVKTTEDALDLLRASQRQYDLDTDHGRNQSY
jgi:predicted secreted Zn-dependent protease